MALDLECTPAAILTSNQVDWRSVLKIGEIARRSGMSVDTLRYYEKIGLLPRIGRDDAGRRSYPDEMLKWLEFVGRLKATDMPVREMCRYAQLRAEGDSTGPERRALLAAHREVIRARIAVLQENLAVLDQKIEFYDNEEYLK